MTHLVAVIKSMIKRRNLRWFFLFSFLIVVFILQMMLESLNDENRNSVEKQLDDLEESMRQLRQKLRSPIVLPSDRSDQCLWRNSSPLTTNLQSQQLYESLAFDNPILSIWEQGFPIEYNRSQWSKENKLKVILMPHSHCDPGWLNTFEVYFHHATRHILNTILIMLQKNVNYKFIWAEMSYLSLWWDEANEHDRNLLKKFLQNRQLEIVTGGWVMNDEANTHFYAMLDQLIEGHQFIASNFENLTIESSWANDPFGYSPTMTYLLKGAEIKHMAIQRVHYHVKKALAKEKNLEFRWQQTWDRDDSTAIFTHMLPFVSYDIPHSCGPDPKICCQFDFRRGFDSYQSCSWGVDPVTITDENVQERSSLLLDQYRKKAQLYRSNVLLVPLGDDFRYQHVREAERQFDNYDRLFSYMNQRTDWHVEARYGTLTDYFDELFHQQSIDQFPSFSGDFFTYADRNDEYWSGYFTSRAFYKRMDRVVQSYLRASEIVFSATQIRLDFHHINDRQFLIDHLNELTRARRSLGLFQHHDGITGTARAHVVQDYGKKLLQAIHLSQNVLQQSINRLLAPNLSLKLNSNEEFLTFDSLPKKNLILAKDLNPWSHRIFIYNPTDRRRIELIHLFIDIYQIYITSNDQIVTECQIDPKWNDEEQNRFEDDQFELSIRVDVDPYTIKEYTIHRTDTKERSCSRSTIEYFHEQHFPNKNASKIFPIRIHTNKFIIFENRYLAMRFSQTGAILSLENRQNQEKLRFNSRVISYTTSRLFNPHSGAYLFIPSGNAEEITISNDRLVRFQRGSMIDRLDLIDRIYALQYQLTNVNGVSDRLVGLTVKTHLQMNQDTELALRFNTGIQNGPDFFTDLNGFQMIRRKTYEKIPLQGNVYPMASMAYLEDQFFRLTILAGQPSGISSLKSGMIDLFIDRRLRRDDGRGLGQGVMDNRPIESSFQILFETRSSTIDKSSMTGYPTLFAHQRSIEQLYPIKILHSSLTSQSGMSPLNIFHRSIQLPSDYHLVNLRTLKSSFSSLDKRIALILRRFASDCSSIQFDNDENLIDQIKFNDLFADEKIRQIAATSLTLQTTKQFLLNSSSIISIPFAEVRTYRIDLF